METTTETKGRVYHSTTRLNKKAEKLTARIKDFAESALTNNSFARQVDFNLLDKVATNVNKLATIKPD